MFDKISLQQQQVGDADHPLDLPFLAEAMLFYGHVEVVSNRASLGQLVRKFEPETLLEFLTRGYLRVKFEPNFAGVITKDTGTLAEQHTPSVFRIQGQDLLDVLKPLVTSAVGRVGKGRRLALRLANKIQSVPIDENLRVRVAADFVEELYIAECVKRMLRVYVPGAPLPADLRFEITPIADTHFRINTNLDFPALNRVYHQHVSASHSSLSPAYLLSHFLTARKILEDGATANAEIAVAPVYQELITAKIKMAFQPREASEEQITAFQRLVFDDGRTFSGVFATNERSFRDLLPVLDKASKFRDWLRQQEPNSDLVKSYFRSATEGSWVDKLPTKTLRWSVFTGAGLIIDALGAGGVGVATGLALGAADTFFLDKLLKGWRPTQYVEQTLSEFVNPPNVAIKND